MDETNINGIRNTTAPQDAEELSEIIYCLQWMQHITPDFT